MAKRRFSRLPEGGIVQLEDLPIHVWLSDRASKVTTITQSPYYVSLNENNPAVFLAYQQAMRGLPSACSEISWEQFLDLKNDIADNGLRDTGAPITLADEGQTDGHHRLAILCYLYGAQARVRISNGVVTFPAHEAQGDRTERTPKR